MISRLWPTYVQPSLSQSNVLWMIPIYLCWKHYLNELWGIHGLQHIFRETDLPFPRVNSLHSPYTASFALIGDLAMALGLLCHRHRQGDSESACQPVMRSLGQTSESHDRSNDTAFFYFFFGSSKLMGSSCDPVRSGVICFKLSYESQWTASIDWPVHAFMSMPAASFSSRYS